MTVLLNHNYSAKMHVDGNNHDPSYINVLGNYTGGAPWTYDRQSTENYMEVADSMRNYSELQVGRNSCHNTNRKRGEDLNSGGLARSSASC